MSKTKERKYTAAMLDANFNAWTARESWVNEQLGELNTSQSHTANSVANLQAVLNKMQVTFGTVLQQVENLRSEVQELRNDLDGDIG